MYLRRAYFEFRSVVDGAPEGATPLLAAKFSRRSNSLGTLYRTLTVSTVVDRETGTTLTTIDSVDAVDDGMRGAAEVTGYVLVTEVGMDVVSVRGFMGDLCDRYRIGVGQQVQSVLVASIRSSSQNRTRGGSRSDVVVEIERYLYLIVD